MVYWADLSKSDDGGGDLGPLSIPTACFNNHDVGGDRISMVYLSRRDVAKARKTERKI